MIEASIYKQITDLIGQSYKNGTDIVEEIDAAVVDLNSSETSANNIDKQWLLNALGSTSTSLNKKHVLYSPELTKLVTVLQQHIVNNYGSIDSFLEDNEIIVSTIFASISEDLGFPISTS
jgi:hypothetical protein